MDTWCEFKMSAKQSTTKLRAGDGRGGKQKAEATGSGALAADQLQQVSASVC